MSEMRIAVPPIEKVDRTPVVFKNEESGLMLAGIIYRPRNRKPDEKLPAIVIGGPMLSAKELVQSLYGQILAEKGYLTMVYDNSTIGSSEGHPRGLEDPEIKAADIRSAVSYLTTLADVDTDKIAGLGICGSGVYIPHALRNDGRVKAVISVVPFTVMSFVTTAADDVLLAQKAAYENGEEPERLDLITGSELTDYYFNTDRGAAANMVNPVSWSQLSWHKFFPTETIKELKVPYLVITAENAFTKEGAEQMYANANEPKELYVVKNAKHSDMYDIEDYVNENIEQIVKFLGKYL